jgi:hypothetical protein
MPCVPKTWRTTSIARHDRKYLSEMPRKQKPPLRRAGQGAEREESANPRNPLTYGVLTNDSSTTFGSRASLFRSEFGAVPNNAAYRSRGRAAGGLARSGGRLAENGLGGVNVSAGELAVLHQFADMAVESFTNRGELDEANTAASGLDPVIGDP